jgi:hypothetical protein
MEERLLTVTVWRLLGDNGLTGQLVRLWRLVMLGWGVKLDG